MIRDVSTRLLVPGQDPEPLAAATLRVLDIPGGAAARARQGHLLVLKYFTAEAMLGGLEEAYGGLLASWRPRS